MKSTLFRSAIEHLWIIVFIGIALFWIVVRSGSGQRGIPGPFIIIPYYHAYFHRLTLRS